MHLHSLPSPGHPSLTPSLACPQAHACAAVVNFAENCDQDVVAPHLDALISKLLVLLTTGKRNVQVRGRVWGMGVG